MSRSIRVVSLTCGILVYAVLARLVHTTEILSESRAAYSSLSPFVQIGFIAASIVILVCAWRTIRRAALVSSDWGLGISGHAWISLPLLAVVLALSIWDAKTGPSVSSSQAIKTTLILLPSSLLIRSFLMRVISTALGQKTGIVWLGVIASGVLFTLVHPDNNANTLADIAANCLSSSYIVITGSVFAPLIYDSVRLLNPPVSQVAVLLPLVGLFVYAIPALIAYATERRARMHITNLEKQ